MSAVRTQEGETMISGTLSKPDNKLQLVVDVEPARVFLGVKYGESGTRAEAYVAFFYRGPEFQIIRAAVRGANGQSRKPGLAIVGATVQVSFLLAPVPKECSRLVQEQMRTFAHMRARPERFGVVSAGSIDREESAYQTFERCVEQHKLIYLRIVGPGDTEHAFATYTLHSVKRELQTFLPERRA